MRYSINIIPSTEDAVAGSDATRFAVRHGETVRLVAIGLATDETVDVESVDGESEAAVVSDAYASGGTTQLSMTATAPVLAISLPGVYQLAKSITAGAAAVYLSR